MMVVCDDVKLFLREPEGVKQLALKLHGKNCECL